MDLFGDKNCRILYGSFDRYILLFAFDYNFLKYLNVFIFFCLSKPVILVLYWFGAQNGMHVSSTNELKLLSDC